MKSHNKYAKLPQDLDLSFQEQLDVDASASDDFNLAAGIGLVDDTDDDVAASRVEGSVYDDDEDEIVIATVASGIGSVGTHNGRGAKVAVRVNTSNNGSGERKVPAGLGNDTLIEVCALNMFEIRDSLQKVS